MLCCLRKKYIKTSSACFVTINNIFSYFRALFSSVLQITLFHSKENWGRDKHNILSWEIVPQMNYYWRFLNCNGVTCPETLLSFGMWGNYGLKLLWLLLQWNILTSETKLITNTPSCPYYARSLNNADFMELKDWIFPIALTDGCWQKVFKPHFFSSSQ